MILLENLIGILTNMINYPTNLLGILIFSILDGGFVVTIAFVIVSVILRKYIEAFNLDLSEIYSVDLIKMQASIVIIITSIYIFMQARGYIKRGEIEIAKPLIQRVVLLGLYVFGTWFGLGYKCEGRLAKKNKTKKKNTINVKMILHYNFYISIGSIVCIILIGGIALKAEQADKIIIMFFALLIIFMSAMLIGAYTERYPNENDSNIILVNAIKLMNNEECVRRYYCSVEYSLSRKADKECLIIHRRNVKYDKEYSKKESDDIFDKKEFPLKNGFKIEELEKLLNKTRDDRCNFIRKEREKSKQTVINNLSK